MCGIAGYSADGASRMDRTLTAQALFASIAERGSDAVGYAYRQDEGGVVVHKQRTGASELLDAVAIPGDATESLLHVRDYTKGHPSLAANNHPIRHGAVVGIHNGVIANDEEIFARHAFARAEPGMTVDSEAIFALVDDAEARRDALDELYGSMATAWLDAREPDVLFLARGVGRPLWIGEGEREALFASTVDALELAEAYARLSLYKREVPEGCLVTLRAGRIAGAESFEPDRSFSEEPLPAVRAPSERASCVERLRILAQRRYGSMGVSAAAR
jgi:glucosamine 6-phosphate synthetase-like amidotransferase/phosphosugar isomerase protein